MSDDGGWEAYIGKAKPLPRKPLKRQKPAAPKVSPPSSAPRVFSASENRARLKTLSAAKTPEKQKTWEGQILERRRERAARQGGVSPEARLDLHGLTQAAAHQAVSGFISAQAQAGRRTVLVITGKGKDGEAVLRTGFLRWCAEVALAKDILAIRPAAPRHGGAGAWYVFLRNIRKS